MKAVIFANGVIKNVDFIRRDLGDADLTICLDGGLRYAHKLGIVPNYILGDFDSVDRDLLEFYQERGSLVEEYPVRKDYTDMELGLDFAIEQEADEIIIFGAMGGRSDHALANILAMIQAVDQGVYPVIAEEKERILVTDRSIDLAAKPGTVISLIPLTPKVTGVETEGLDYPLEGETLYLGYARGVSNVFKDKQARVSLDDGLLLVIINY